MLLYVDLLTICCCMLLLCLFIAVCCIADCKLMFAVIIIADYDLLCVALLTTCYKSHSPFITEEYHKHKRERFWSVLLVSCHQHHRVGGTGGLFRSLVSEGIGLLKNLEVLHLNSKKGL